MVAVGKAALVVHLARHLAWYWGAGYDISEYAEHNLTHQGLHLWISIDESSPLTP